MMQVAPRSFWETPLCLTLALWLCTLPVTLVIVGLLWGLWPAAMAALATLVVMLALCLGLCWREGQTQSRMEGGTRWADKELWLGR